MKPFRIYVAFLILLVCLSGLSPATSQIDSLNIYYGEIPQGERILFVAPDGDNENPGTEEEPWATLDHAVSQLEGRGDVIVMRGGVYDHASTITIQTPSGYFDDFIYLVAYPGEVPILDFSEQPKESGNIGVRLNANFWHVIGITIRNAGHNGIRMDGSFNILEQITAYGNHDTGIHMAGGASYNLVKNCDSFHNFNTTGRVGNNADGFGAKFIIGPGNRFYGCRSWENSDDGYDFWRAENTIVVENCWAFNNGDASVFGDPPNFEGAGNGFKLGGDFVAGDHIVRRSLAFDNKDKGFDHNNNTGALTLLHNSAYKNGRNYYFPRDPTNGQSVFLNNMSAVSSVIAGMPPNALEGGNSWQSGITVTEDMFLSVDTELARGPRREDGSLPDIDLLKPVPDSFLVDGGVLIGEAYYGYAPDIGAYEYGTGELIGPYVERGSGAIIADLLLYDIHHAEAWSIESTFELGTESYGDGTFTIASIPAELRVDEWIRTSVETGSNNFLFVPAECKLLQGIDVFIAHADIITEKPDWLSAYDETNLKIVLSEPDQNDYVLTLYKKTYNANDEIALGRNSNDGAADAPMYIVLAGEIVPVSVAETEAENAPDVSVAVYPNPFNALSTISYSVDARSHVRLSVYDITGRLVDTYVDDIVDRGRHRVTFNGSNLASGTYIIRLMVGNQMVHARMILLR
jgi:hypothetical protein